MAAATGKITASGAVRASLVICALVLLSVALYWASSVFAPLAFALFILALVWPLQQRLEILMPQGLALFLTLAVTVLAMVALGGGLFEGNQGHCFGSRLRLAVGGWPPHGVHQWLVPSSRVILFHTLYLPTGLRIGRRFTSSRVCAS